MRCNVLQCTFQVYLKEVAERKTSQKNLAPAAAPAPKPVAAAPAPPPT